MSAIEIVNKKLAILPLEVQLQVIDYINYLASKYETEEDDEALLEKFLLQRAEETREGKRVSWNKMKAEIYQKYNKDV